MSAMSSTNGAGPVTMMIGAVPVDLCTAEAVLSLVRRRIADTEESPLAIGSVNLDHLHHFAGPDRPRLGTPGGRRDDGVDWVLLADGAPIAACAGRLTGHAWPRLAGADLLPMILAESAAAHRTVGFLGGFPDLHRKLEVTVPKYFPGIARLQFWGPERDEIEDPERSRQLARKIERYAVDVLVVGLGKPRQELWIDHYGASTGARVLLAFGAAADFLAGTATRAPRLLRESGLEWLYRLARDPRRLAHRYLVEGPPAFLTLHRARLAPEFRSALE